RGRAVDQEGFDTAMAEQKAKARAAWAGSGETKDAAIWHDLAERHGATEFLGYETDEAEGQILALVVEGAEASEATEGAEVQIVVNQSPFYAESGGQVGDTGLVRTETGAARVTDTRKVAGVFTHMAEVTLGTIAKGQGAQLSVDRDRRGMIRANHSATHLLHEALRRTLGAHVAQRGSLNAPDRLRFDFSHNHAVTPEEVSKIEAEVNDFIRQNSPVETRIMTPDDARALGAQALFGEKYGDEVRVVSMGRQGNSGKGTDGQTYSLELCGGTHVLRTGDIGAFALLGDSASSAGVRRIEALTGQAALDHLRAADRQLAEIATLLKAQAGDVVNRVRALADERKALASEVAQLKRQLAMGGGGATEAKEIAGVKFIGRRVEGVGGKELGPLIDEMKAKLGSGAVLVLSEADGKATVAAGVTPDLTDRLSAVSLVQAATAALGGKGGGGRPDRAQGGAPGLEAAESAFAEVEKLIGATL
ncbi:MAG: alanine--tRNA ligase-related protein, partial [Paracoccus sp.]|nr:alanine--tRNA ligase-related protein [Paracoccus sp. (in: a-proteobacteria)]